MKDLFWNVLETFHLFGNNLIEKKQVFQDISAQVLQGVNPQIVVNGLSPFTAMNSVVVVSLAA